MQMKKNDFKAKNLVQIEGQLSTLPRIKINATGKKVASFFVSEKIESYSAAGICLHEKKWHRVIAWKELANAIESGIAKGMPLLVSGWILKRSYTDVRGRSMEFRTLVAREITVLYHSQNRAK
jgi:single-stranded DNA-binding protein